MRKVFFILGAIICFGIGANAQITVVGSEDFDGNIKFSSTPGGAWTTNTDYKMSGNHSFYGKVPSSLQDSIVLVSPLYDCRNYNSVILRFKHICKVSPSDIACIEYRQNYMGAQWTPIPAVCYVGKGSYTEKGFNASTYLDWKEQDSLCFPDQSWWKEEVFDVTVETRGEEVQFRFFLKHGAAYGSQISYGWLIDDFILEASSNYTINIPSVRLLTPVVKGVSYHTGPFDIKAKITNDKKTPLSQISLVYTVIDSDGVHASPISISMDNKGNDIWQATIPQIEIGNDVSYYVIATDTASIYGKDYGYYSIQSLSDNRVPGYVVIGTDDLTYYQAPVYTNYPYSYSRQLYLASELSPSLSGGYITKLAWDYAYDQDITYKKQTCYLRAVDVTSISTSYDSPITNGATKVYEGIIDFSKGWSEIIFDVPFYLPPGKNLLVYWDNENGSYPGSTYVFNHSPSPQNVLRNVYYYSSTQLPTENATYSSPYNRPNIRLQFAGEGNGDNAAGLTSFDEPTTAIGLQSMTVKATMKNKGTNNLISASFGWTVNGTLMPTPTNFSGDLPWDFDQQITFGQYPSNAGKYDTIKLWVSMPNGVNDLTTSDDTLVKYLYGCPVGGLAGDYSIGNGGDFRDIDEAMNVLKSCGAIDDVNFKFKNGTYTVNNLRINIDSLMHPYTLTITSEAGNKASVTLLSSSTNESMIIFRKVHNITIRDITLNGESISSTHTIEITEKSSNIVFYNCDIFGNATGTSSAVINKAPSTEAVDGFTLKNCTIRGQYYGLYYYSSNTAYNLNTTIDSNTFLNQYSYAVYTYYTNCKSISGNTILSKSSGSMTSFWYGLYLNYGFIERICNNRIKQLSETINYPYAMRVNYINNGPTPCLIANNEIIVSMNATSSSYSAVYSYYTSANFYHNSIYVKGRNTHSIGLYLSGSNTNYINIFNNQFIVTAGASAYPIYLATTSNASQWLLNYNNYYSPTNIGYAGAARTSMTAWQAAVAPRDINSVTFSPSFSSTPVFTAGGVNNHLKLSSDANFSSPIISEIDRDIENAIRAGSSSMGCYKGSPVAIDGILLEILGLDKNAAIGSNTDIKAVIFNGGSTPITGVTLDWTFNSVSESQISRPLSLTYGMLDTILLGTVSLAEGRNTAKVWISALDGLTDPYKNDDTLEISVYSCQSVIAGGTYIIGQGGDYTSISKAVDALANCGITGPIIMNILPGNYTENVTISHIQGSSPVNTVTFVSSTNNPASVSIISNTVALRLDNVSNIILRDISIDASSGQVGIEMAKTCSNIEIRNCIIRANPGATSHNLEAPSAGIYYNSSEGSGYKLDNVRIIENTFDGGYNNIYIYYGGYGSGNSMSDLTIDSNTLINAYYSGLYLYYYNYFRSLSYNTIKTRPGGTNSQYGIYVNTYCTFDTIQHNKIYLQGGSTSHFGMVLFNFINQSITYKAKGKAYIANNEITMPNSSGQGLQLSSVSADFLHNTFYTNGTSTCYGVYIASHSSTYSMTFKNNLFYLNGSSGSTYAYYFNNASHFVPGNTVFDYNNYYNMGTNFAYLGGSILPTLSTWQTTTGQDNNSTQILPLFNNPYTDLTLSNYEQFLCPSVGVPVDLKNEPRGTMTYMGCYTMALKNFDILLQKLNNWYPKSIIGQTLNINVRIVNLGITTAKEIILGWKLNGVVQSISHFPSLNLTSNNMVDLQLGSFVVPEGKYEIEVWIDSVNQTKDENQSNDTLVELSETVPLVEFVTTWKLKQIQTYPSTFDVFANIETVTGAPISPPTLVVITKRGQEQLASETVPMIQQTDGLWKASLNTAGYGTFTVYSLTVADRLGLQKTITDSVYVEFVKELFPDSVTIGTYYATSNSYPYNTYGAMGQSVSYNYSCSRSIYMNYEIDPNREGLFISHIAYNVNSIYNSATPSVKNNLSIYFLATTDSVFPTNMTSSYINPIDKGATLVWGKASITVSTTGWFTIKLDTQFYLPGGMNLMVFWNDEDGSYADNGSYLNFQQTNGISNVYKTHYANASSWPPNSFYTSMYRPVVRLKTLRGSEKHAGDNVGIMEVVSPKTIISRECVNDYEDLRISLVNTGINNIDFSTENLLLNVEVTAPIPFSTQLKLNKGILLSGVKDTITLTNVLPVALSGIYDIKMWLTAAQQDDILYDDTLLYYYTTNKINLPVDEDFSSGLPQSFISASLTGNSKWQVVQGSNVNRTVTSNYGGSMLSFSGTRGSMSRLSTRQLDLAGTSQPVLEFWYAHDTAKSSEFVEVKITLNGTTYQTLKTVYKQDTMVGWKKYEIDLSRYTSNPCVIISFEAQVNSTTDNGEQNIDRIRIAASQDLSVAAIILPEVSVCNLENQEIKVVLENKTGQTISFDSSPTSLFLDITGAKNEQLQYNLIGRTIGSLEKDTITITSDYDFIKGIYNFTAFVSPSIDLNSMNDTIQVPSVEINPHLSLMVNSLTNLVNCFKIGDVVYQDIILQNIGNMDLEDIELELIVTAGDDYSDTVRETETIDLPVGADTSYTFKNSYTVPASAEAIYQVRVRAWLKCNIALLDTSDAETECVDMYDLSLISIDNPVTGQIDKVDSTESVTISVENADKNSPFENIPATAQIEDRTGQVLKTLTGIIPKVEPSSLASFTFTEKYTVPADSVYFIRVYVSSGDFYPENDTSFISRRTDYNPGGSEPPGVVSIGSTNAFTLGQNIPNPANNTTRIGYAVPEAGQIIFHVHSISGQLLYSKTIEASRGTNSIELNTSTFAAGVYVYSMEYKGQRLVRQLIISN
jgi:hypothetical protein